MKKRRKNKVRKVRKSLRPMGYVINANLVIPKFEIVSNPMIKISDIKRRRFNIIDRGQTK